MSENYTDDRDWRSELGEKWAELTPESRHSILERIKASYSDVQTANRHTDTKAGPIIIVSGALLAATTQVLLAGLMHRTASPVHLAIVIMVAIPLFCSVGCSLLSLVPRLGDRPSSWQGDEKTSASSPLKEDLTTLYFGHIVEFPSLTALGQEILRIGGDEFEEFGQLLRQLRVNAQIATRKYRLILFASRFLLVALLFVAFGALSLAFPVS